MSRPFTTESSPPSSSRSVGSPPVGAPIALLAESEEEVAFAQARAQALSKAPGQGPPPPHAAAAAPVASRTKGIAAPHAKKLAKQHRVDIAKVVGSGPQGRITVADTSAAGIKPEPQVATPPPPAARPALPAAAPLVGSGRQSAVLPPVPGGTVVPFTTMQVAVSRNMVESLSVPTLRVGYAVMTDNLDALYEKVKLRGVTNTLLLVKAAAMALTQHPVVNASCRDGKSFSYNSSNNIAVAVACEGGLLTPVLEDVDKVHSIRWIYICLHKSGEACSRKFDAILRPGLGAIMAVMDGFFSIKNKMLVNVTADHRIIYGAGLAAFMRTFAKIVEDPESLTL